MNKQNINSKTKYLATNHDIEVLKIKTERNSLGILKTIIIFLLIAIQFAGLILANLYFAMFVTWFTTFSLTISIITCIYVLSTNKNSQSKPIWIMFLLTCFTFGYLLYFISNEKLFWGKNKIHYNQILENSYKYQKNSVDLNTSNQSIKNDCQYLKSSGNFSTYTNTKTKYFSSGTKIFDNILSDLENAKDFIFIEFFIIADGVLLKRILNILKEKASQGIDVRIIYDDFGSHGSLKRKTKKQIKKAGIKLLSFNKLLPKFSVLLNYRDHRKIVVIDGKIAYTGGANLADEYINEKRAHGYWKDSGIRLDGPAVDGLTLTFLRQWEFVSKQKENYDIYLNLYSTHPNQSLIVPYSDGLEYSDNIGKNVYTNMIANANEKIYIMSPYFVIDDTINNLLINKAKAGVDVRIILPEIADKKLVYVISRNNAEKLVTHGVKLYTMKNSFVHSKILLNEYSAVIGSINMDLRSFYQQFESAIYLTDKNTMSEILTDFDDTFSKSTLIEKDRLKRNNFVVRIIAGITNLISPFM